MRGSGHKYKVRAGFCQVKTGLVRWAIGLALLCAVTVVCGVVEVIVRVGL